MSHYDRDDMEQAVNSQPTYEQRGSHVIKEFEPLGAALPQVELTVLTFAGQMPHNINEALNCVWRARHSDKVAIPELRCALTYINSEIARLSNK